MGEHERFCSDDEFQVYVVDTSTWTGVQHHGDNVYFDTYECGVVEIRITADVTEPESITELNVGDMVLAKEPHSRKRTYKGVVKERTADARYKIQALPHSRKIVSTIVFRREDLKLTRQAVAVYRITDEATFKYDGYGYGYGHDELSYREQHLQMLRPGPRSRLASVRLSARPKVRVMHLPPMQGGGGDADSPRTSPRMG